MVGCRRDTVTVGHDVTRLGPADLVPRRVFTHPDHIEADRAVLRVLIADLYRHVAGVGAVEHPVLRYIPDEEDWFRRVVIPCPETLLGLRRMSAVGFFGRVRDSITPAIAQRIAGLSRELVEAVVATPGILGYSTHLLADERNYANLVLLKDVSVIECWKAQPTHDTAARVESPNYYEYVRIYYGSVRRDRPGDAADLRLHQVKYLDYRNDSVWLAVRDLT